MLVLSLPWLRTSTSREAVDRFQTLVAEYSQAEALLKHTSLFSRFSHLLRHHEEILQMCLYLSVPFLARGRTISLLLGIITSSLLSTPKHSLVEGSSAGNKRNAAARHDCKSMGSSNYNRHTAKHRSGMSEVSGLHEGRGPHWNHYVKGRGD